jgi:hypothetical protein
LPRHAAADPEAEAEAGDSSTPRRACNSLASSAALTGDPKTPWPMEHASTTDKPANVRNSATVIEDVACAVVIAATQHRRGTK